MFKVNNRNVWCRSGVFIVNFEYISHLVLVFLLLNFEQVNADMEAAYKNLKNKCIKIRVNSNIETN